jgi:hypothetical protein
MLLEELQHTLLGCFIAAVGYRPNFGFQFIVGSLAAPYIVHLTEGFLYSRYGEELVVLAIDEKHWLGAGHTGYMRIIHPTAETGEAVGKAAVLGT